jgi:hypothetical protein
MTELVAHGVEVTLPAGFEGRLFRRPLAGEIAAADTSILGEPAASEETTNAVLHVATVPLPPDTGDFGSNAVDLLDEQDIFVALFEYDPSSATEKLFASRGIPRRLTADDFSPNVLQRGLPGQCGTQRFFNERGRAFCLYVVLGSFARRRNVVPRVNQVLDSIAIESRDPVGGATPPSDSSTSTTAPPDTTTTSQPEPTPTEPTPTEPTPTEPTLTEPTTETEGVS